jgi:hypothetical protein
VGALAGARIGISMAVGAVLLAFVVGPAALARGAISSPSVAWLEVGLWVGAPMMVSAGVVSLLLGWRTAWRGLLSLGGGTGNRSVEVPQWVFFVGTIVAGGGLMVIGNAYLDVPLLWGAVALLMVFALALVASRATGETDITPTGAMGTLTQLAFGAFLPGNATANLGTACMAGSAALSSADLLTDLKSGYLLGASPRRQFAAQLLGILPGTVAAVLCYLLLVPDATVLTGKGGAPPTFPAPAAQMWATMARLFTGHTGGLHPFCKRAIAVSAIVGALLAVAEKLPPRVRRWFPSPTGVGLGFTMPFQYPFSMCLGAVLGALWMRRRPAQAESYLTPAASGIIAGESIVGVVVVVINNLFL